LRLTNSTNKWWRKCGWRSSLLSKVLILNYSGVCQQVSFIKLVGFPFWRPSLGSKYRFLMYFLVSAERLCIYDDVNETYLLGRPDGTYKALFVILLLPKYCTDGACFDVRLILAAATLCSTTKMLHRCCLLRH
jgi:hypothetical protein